MAIKSPIRALVAAGLVAGALPAQDQLAADWARVSAPPPVTNMGMPEDTDAKRIDGRWWTKDNREVVRTESGIYRVAARDPNYRLYHLRPMDPAKANQLHLYMTPDQVMDVLGNPNDMRVYQEGRTEPNKVPPFLASPTSTTPPPASRTAWINAR